MDKQEYDGNKNNKQQRNNKQKISLETENQVRDHCQLALLGHPCGRLESQSFQRERWRCGSSRSFLTCELFLLIFAREKVLSGFAYGQCWMGRGGWLKSLCWSRLANWKHISVLFYLRKAVIIRWGIRRSRASFFFNLGNIAQTFPMHNGSFIVLKERGRVKIVVGIHILLRPITNISNMYCIADPD